MAITILRATIIYIFVILAVRIMGRRQIGELSTHEFVITILISAVATVPLEDNEIPLSNSLLPILIFISFEILESAVSLKSLKFRDFIQGKPLFIIRNGKLNQTQMRRLRMTLDDVLDGLRQKDIFDISEIKNAVVETNGKLSLQKKTDKESVPTPVIEDGAYVTEYFGEEKTSEAAIDLLLSSVNCRKEELLLMTVDENGKIYLIKKEDTP